MQHVGIDPGQFPRDGELVVREECCSGGLRVCGAAWGGIEQGCDPGPQKRQPPQQEAEVVAGRRQHRVDCVTLRSGQVVAAHAVLALERPDHRFPCGAAAEGTLDGRGQTPLLPAT